MKKLSILLICTTFIYCTKKEDNISTANADSSLIKQTNSQNLFLDSDQAINDISENGNNESAIDENSISINEISNLPSDIDGCGSYFSDSKSKYNSSKFIYVDNTQNAYMNINGDLEMFDIDKNTENETFLSNEKYKIHINSKKISDLEEGILLKGNIEITSKINSDKNNIEFYGETGC